MLNKAHTSIIAKIFSKIILAYVVIAVTCLFWPANAQSASDAWENGDATISNTPPRPLSYQQATNPNRIKPLPSPNAKAAQPDALSLNWQLRLLRPLEPSELNATGLQAEPQFGNNSVAGDYNNAEAYVPAIMPAEGPAWLNESPLWVFIKIKSNIADSYFYAPFSSGQSPEEQRESAKAVLPTELQIITADGEAIPEVKFYYPSGDLTEDSFSGMLLPVYRSEIVVAAPVPAKFAGQKLGLKVSALICTKTSCTPFRKQYPLSINITETAVTALDPGFTDALTNYRTAPFEKAITTTLTAQSFDDQAVSESGADKFTNNETTSSADAFHFTPSDAAADEEIARLFNTQSTEAVASSEAPAERTETEGALTGFIDSLTPQYYVDSLEVSSIWSAIILGLLAGFILNFMPCVLPVISLKLGTLVGLGGWDALTQNDEMARRNRKRFRLYGICFTLGVFVWFAMLFGVIGFAGMMWGQFFQSQQLLLGLAILLFIMALSMFGIVRIPLINIQVGSKAGLPYQAFFGGLLATLLATPCSGPLLGGVLGWAVTQSLNYLGITLLAVAAGMSSPFIIMAIKPGLARFLPKPGPWNQTLEKFMGFVLLATVIYLLSMVEQTKIFVVLSSLLVLAFAAWLWSRPIAMGKSRLSLGRVLALVLIIPALYIPFTQRVVDTSWKNFSAPALQAELGKQNILIDFTADWCINCRAMEMTTLNEQRLTRWAKKYDLSLIKVDLTGHNPDGESLLDAMGSASIPLLAIIPANDPQNPLVLRDLVTPGQLDSAFKQVFKR